MAEAPARQRLAAILVADVAGYTRLMRADEPATVAALDAARAVFRGQIEARDGRVVDMAGDSVLAVFDSAGGAVQAALAIQESLAAASRTTPADRRMAFRIGVNLGDVIEKSDGTVYGDGVNVAARLEGLAEPGGIMVSEEVYRQTAHRLDIAFADAGAHRVKNVPEPIRVYRWMTAGVGDESPKWRLRAALIAGVVIALGVAGAWQAGMFSRSPPAALELPSGPSIAVLPFDNLGGDPQQDYFADGLTEDLIAALTRFRHLFVFARNTMFRYKGGAVDVAEVRRDLGVDYVIEGSVRIDRDRVRIVVQLVDAESGGHLWAETYDNELANVFDVQSEITARIVGIVAGSRGRLAEAGLGRASSTRNLEAYDRVLRAQKFYRSFSEADHAEALGHLEQAVALDPDYSLAYAHLAQLLVYEYAVGYNRRPRAGERALAAAQRAVELAPSDAFAHFALGHVYALTGQREKLLGEIDQVLALNPNDAHALGDLGDHLIYFGELERGLAMVEKAYKLNPGYSGYYRFARFHIHFLRGEYEEALEHAEAAPAVGYWRTHMMRMAAYGQLGRTAEARAAYEKVLALRPDFPDIILDSLAKFYPHEPLREALLDGLRKAGLDTPPAPG